MSNPTTPTREDLQLLESLLAVFSREELAFLADHSTTVHEDLLDDLMGDHLDL